MNIIEKLGMKSYFRNGIVNGDIILELEQENRELLEALIEILNGTYININPLEDERFRDDYDDVISIIEKADPQHRTWEEIKELKA